MKKAVAGNYLENFVVENWRFAKNFSAENCNFGD